MMKLNWFFEPNRDPTQVDIHLHLTKRTLVERIERAIQPEVVLEVSEITTGRKRQLAMDTVVFIEAMDHVSKLYTIDQQVFYLKGRLKEFDYLTTNGMVRINNTTILNLAKVSSFQTERNACLRVYTKNESFRVSRHYTKAIRQYLLQAQIDRGGENNETI